MKTIVLILNILLIIVLIPSIMIAITSPMIFAAKETNRLWWTAGTAVALPLSIIICGIISWRAYYQMDYSFAFKISMIPVFNGFLLIYFMLTMDQ
ncbi:hypothetical protein [Emticicia sp.]|uniref:hypothetical protein n=1 Tax=Emticicia sp. TaxID=1930953 RepID=UPI0037513FAE